MTLEDNLLLGNQALSYARGIIKSSSTAISTPKEDILRISADIRRMRNATLDSESSLKMLFRVPSVLTDSDVMEMKWCVKMAKQFSVGNCVEYAQLVVNYLRKMDVGLAELFEIKQGDHVFVVIGRAEDSDPTKPETWGPDAVVCDAWSNKVYPATDIMQHLMCYRYLEDGKNDTYPFDPTKQTLNLISRAGEGSTVSRHYTLKDATRKLSLIQDTVKNIVAADVASQQLLLDEIEHDLNLLKPDLQRSMFQSYSDNAYERHLSKTISRYLRRALDLTKTADREPLIRSLVSDWCTTISTKTLQDTAWGGGFFQSEYQPTETKAVTGYYNMLVHCNDDVFFQLVSRLSRRMLNTTLFTEMYYKNKSLLDTLLKTGRLGCFVQLINKLDGDNVAYLNNVSKLSYNNIPIKMLHATAYLESYPCFMALLEKLSKNTLKSCAAISVEGKTLPEIVREHLGEAAYSALLNKLEIYNPNLRLA